MPLTRRTRKYNPDAKLVDLDDDVDQLDRRLSRKSKPENQVTGPSSQSQSSQISKLSASKSFLKKRTAQEITPSSLEPTAKDERNWAEKYAPKSVADLAINAKKVDEFRQLVAERKMLIVTGPSGCAKTTMVRTFCAENNIQLSFHKNEKQAYVEELYTETVRIGNTGQPYPSDVLSLREFIAKIKTKTANAQGTKVSRFCKAQVTPQKFVPGGKQLYIVQGLPEALKLPSQYRALLVADFMSEVANFLERSDGVLIFLFGEAYERSQPFLTKVFGQRILSHRAVG